MEDVQSLSPSVSIGIDRVGVRGLKRPLLVRDRVHGMQQTVASVDLGVDLPSAFKGTHMSRFVETLEAWEGEISYQAVRHLLEKVRHCLSARRAWAHFTFSYFVNKPAPASGRPGTVHYDCRLTGELDEQGQHFLLGLDVPVMTVCPCSKAISSEGAHSQRAMVHMEICLHGFSWLEEFIEIAEGAGSSAIFSLLKREDEKFVTEQAFANPVFVEDVVRNVAQRLAAHKHVGSFSVEVESMESIHHHNAFARIEGQGAYAATGASGR
ncbi:MAG: GTP cyclohydrolase I FolE2 [Desulfovibrio sp.]|nr:GTP cyclohydrolase I FolE2 [Desulfovibrio sp.]